MCGRTLPTISGGTNSSVSTGLEAILMWVRETLSETYVRALASKCRFAFWLTLLKHLVSRCLAIVTVPWPARLTSMSNQALAIMSRLAGLPVPKVIPLVSATWEVLLTPRATWRCPIRSRLTGVPCREKNDLCGAKLEVESTTGTELHRGRRGGEEDVAVPHRELVHRVHQDVRHLARQVAVHQVRTGGAMTQLPNLLHVDQHLLHAGVQQRQLGIDQRDVVPDDVLRLHSICWQAAFYKRTKRYVSEEVASLKIHKKGIKAKLPAKCLLYQMPEDSTCFSV